VGGGSAVLSNHVDVSLKVFAQWGYRKLDIRNWVNIQHQFSINQF
jgi:hypothetical protein